MSDWHDISTAPKDGTDVDLWIPEFPKKWGTEASKRVTNAHWGMETQNGFGDKLKGPGWVAITYDVTATAFFSLVDGDPSHYMPIPGEPE